jgi:SAM-dependent methyltransferase
MSCEDDAFFEHMWECRENYRKLARAELAVTWPVPHSILDIGCGVGHGVAFMQEMLPDTLVTGWDLHLAVSHARKRYPHHRFLTFDLDTRDVPADLVICTETAEHLPECDADRFVDCVTAAVGHTLVWSAAPPGQKWIGHVNLQPPEYWLTKLRAHGLAVDSNATQALRATMWRTEAQHMYCNENFYVLHRPPQTHSPVLP